MCRKNVNDMFIKFSFLYIFSCLRYLCDFNQCTVIYIIHVCVNKALLKLIHVCVNKLILKLIYIIHVCVNKVILKLIHVRVNKVIMKLNIFKSYVHAYIRYLSKHCCVQNFF